MSKQANPIAVGGFVLGAIGLIVVAILVFGSGALFKKREEFVSFFPGTVQGLSVGSAVQFQGVTTGQVTDIKLDYFSSKGEITIPVFFDFWPDTLRFVEGRPDYDATPELVERFGLRAKLETLSLVTGQNVVSLSFAPDTPVVYRGKGLADGVMEIPTLESTRDRLSDMLKGLSLGELVRSATSAFEAIDALVTDEATKSLAGNANGALSEARKLIAHVDASVGPLTERADSALADYSELAKAVSQRVETLAERIEQTVIDIGALAQRMDGKVDPISASATGALNQAQRAFRSVDGLIGADSATRYDLDLLLKEAASAARSLRLFADYLEQNPDALLRGKY